MVELEGASQLDDVPDYVDVTTAAPLPSMDMWRVTLAVVNIVFLPSRVTLVDREITARCIAFMNNVLVKYMGPKRSLARSFRITATGVVGQQLV